LTVDFSGAFDLAVAVVAALCAVASGASESILYPPPSSECKLSIGKLNLFTHTQ
jgi:hypothetical protein